MLATAVNAAAHFKTATSISRQIYVDPGLYEAERRAVFERTWLFVAHLSEIPNEGDYITTTLADRPVIVIRTGSASVEILLNTCTHRGMQVATEARGNARSFTCPYHNWTFERSGALRSRPDEEAYGGDFDKSCLSLRRVPRVEIFCELVFASFLESIEPFPAYLGDAAPWIEKCYWREGGYEVRGYHRYRMHTNWKLIQENLADGYHVRALHRTAARGPWVKGFLAGRQHGFRNGHCMLTWKAPVQERLLERDSPISADQLQVMTMCVFPNLQISTTNNRPTVRRIIPHGVEYADMVGYALVPRSMPKKEGDALARQYGEFYGPAGGNNVDDVEAFELSFAGMRIPEVGWSDASRGVHAGSEDVQDETAVHAFYDAWVQLMSGVQA